MATLKTPLPTAEKMEIGKIYLHVIDHGIATKKSELPPAEKMEIGKYYLRIRKL